MSGDALLRARDALASWDPRSARDALKGADRISGAQTGSYVAWVNGVLRHRRTLGVVLGAVARRALKKRAPDVVAALELSAFRVLFQGVDPSRVRAQFGKFEASKKVRDHMDHVLAALEACLAERVIGAFDTADDARDDLLPVSRTEAVRFSKPLLGIEGRKPAGRLGILHSLPDPLVAFDCRLTDAERVGTHFVLFAGVEDIAIADAGAPLIYANRAYGRSSLFQDEGRL